MSRKGAPSLKERGSGAEATVRVRAVVGDKGYAFEVRKGANLLGSALKAKVPLDHICRVGLCGTCQVCVEEGRESAGPPTDQEKLFLDDVPLREGVRLACQVIVGGDMTIRQ